jgi:two-component system, chemotaxis family, protein-glutamate methylesterase/glutaminase
MVDHRSPTTDPRPLIKVLVVEDSKVIREFVAYILNSDPKIKVIDMVCNGEEALEAVERLKPDVITMDIHMPKMGGLEATRRIMETYPTPIVIVSGSSTAKEAASTFNALEAGAVAFIPRPKGIGTPEYESMAKELVQTVKLVSEVKVVKRWPRYRKQQTVPSVPAVRTETLPAQVQVVAIGCSTGGPMALKTIISGLPNNFPVPLLIVQHISPGFIEGFVQWLTTSSSFPVKVAAHGEYLLPGHAYVAPDGFHMEVDADKRIILNTGEPENGLRPSVSHLLRSVTRVFGKHAVGMLLTGMGKDGAKELKIMREKGAVTIVQDKESSVVHGMPGEAVVLGAAMYVLSPEEIADLLKKLVGGP